MKSLLLLLVTTILICAQTKLELRHADYNMNRLVDGSIITNLVGNVEFQYGNVNIKADSTLWKRGEGELILDGSVVVHQPAQILYCDSLRFLSAIKKFELRGNTKMVDSTREVTMASPEADFFLEEDSLEMRYDPKVWFWSSNDTDTVVVTGEPMHYLGESGTARVGKDIRIEGRNMLATAKSGFYSVELAQAELRDSARATYNLSEIAGGLIRLYAGEEKADSFTVIYDNPLGITRDTVGEDTTVNRLTGDSLHFLLDTNRVERVVSVGDAMMEQFPTAREGDADIVWGNRIVANMFETGGGTALSQGNARSLYRSEGDMVNEIAGDTLFLTYDSLGVDEITLTGGVQGVILPKEAPEE